MRWMAGDTLEYNAALWAGNKFLTKVSQPPDLTAMLWYNLGCMRAIMKDYHGAVEAFKKAVSKEPSRIVFRHELAKALQVTLKAFHSHLYGFPTLIGCRANR